MSDGPLNWTTNEDGSRQATFKLGDKFGTFRVRPHEHPEAKNNWIAEGYIHFTLLYGNPDEVRIELEEQMQHWLDQMGGQAAD